MTFLIELIVAWVVTSRWFWIGVMCFAVYCGIAKLFK